MATKKHTKLINSSFEFCAFAERKRGSAKPQNLWLKESKQ
jgi:hypothetical protein